MILSFLKPTKDKILITILIILMILMAKQIGNLSRILFIPEQLAGKPFSEFLEKNPDEAFEFIMKSTLIKNVIYIIFLYITACIIPTHLKNRKLWIFVVTAFIFIYFLPELFLP